MNLKEHERKCLDIENTFLIRMYFVTVARGLGANAFGLVLLKIGENRIFRAILEN